MVHGGLEVDSLRHQPMNGEGLFRGVGGWCREGLRSAWGEGRCC